VLEVPLWAGLLLALVGSLLLLLAVLYVTVRRQALDTEYREEIR
jgi:heme A synthase